MDQTMYNWSRWEPHTLQEQVTELRDLLEHERRKNQCEYNTRMQLCRELEDTRRELALQKKKKEMFINKEKETRKELARLTELSDPQTVKNMMLATQVYKDIKIKKKKVLQKEHEDLKMAHILSQEKFTEELQAEKDENKTLQQEVDRLRKVNLRHEVQLRVERERSDSLQNDLQKMSEDLEAMKLVAEVLETSSST